MSGATQEPVFLARPKFEQTSPQPHPGKLSPDSRMRSPIGQPQPDLALRHQLFQGSPPMPNRVGSPLPPPPLAHFDPIRLQQLYTLALADKMRLFQHQQQGPPLFPPYSPGSGHPFSLASPGVRLPLPPLPPPPTHPGSHPVDFAYAYGKFDPRFFRVPDEPKPQHSYIGLIAMAILSCKDQKLVLADIYQYILDNFSYFRHRGPGWRNSIRHNLSLNDCFIKAGRAANGKGHFWAIHPACIEDFKRGDFRRRKAQRKVRRHMGLAVDEEDSPSPPPPPSLSPGMSQAMGLPLHWLGAAAGLRPPPPPPHFLHPLHRAGFPPHLPNVSALSAAHSTSMSHNNNNTHQTTLSTPTTVKRQFDVDSLLGGKDISAGQEMAKRLRQEVEERIMRNQMERKTEDSNSLSGNEDEHEGQENLDVVSLVGEEEDLEESHLDQDEEKNDCEQSNGDIEDRRRRHSPEPPNGFSTPIFGQAWAAAAAAAAGKSLNLNFPPISTADNNMPPVPSSAQEYFARYYQMMQQQQTAAAALSAAAQAAAEASVKLGSPRLHRGFESGIEQQTN